MRTATAWAACGALAAFALAGPATGDEGDKATESSVLWALRWLKNHQAPDGHWDAKSYDAQCKLNRCDGAGAAPRETTSTGLALLAFLGAGHTQRDGPYKTVVEEGLKRLRAIQDPQGFYGDRAAPDALVGHAVATLAFTEVRGMTGDRDLDAPAQRAVSALFASPAAVGPWRADFAKDGAVDAKALPWVVFVLKSAEIAKLDVDPDAMKRVVAWFEARTDAKTGAATDPATKRADDALTAVGAIARAFVGRTPKTDPVMAAAAATLAKNVSPDSAPPFVRHFATLAAFIASPDAPAWTRWSAATKVALLKAQRMEPDRDERGSWEPTDASMKSGGRMIATALSCLTLEAVGHAR